MDEFRGGDHAQVGGGVAVVLEGGDGTAVGFHCAHTGGAELIGKVVAAGVGAGETGRTNERGAHQPVGRSIEGELVEVAADAATCEELVARGAKQVDLASYTADVRGVALESDAQSVAEAVLGGVGKDG